MLNIPRRARVGGLCCQFWTRFVGVCEAMLLNRTAGDAVGLKM